MFFCFCFPLLIDFSIALSFLFFVYFLLLPSASCFSSLKCILSPRKLKHYNALSNCKTSFNRFCANCSLFRNPHFTKKVYAAYLILLRAAILWPLARRWWLWTYGITISFLFQSLPYYIYDKVLLDDQAINHLTCNLSFHVFSVQTM